MRRALQMLDDGNPDGIVLLEAGLVGALMLDPTLRLYGALQTLRPADFVGRHRGAAFGVVMDEPHPELALVVERLEREGIPHPPNRTGWGDALSRLLDVALVDDEAIPVAARRIKEAALARKAARRASAA
jgi:hypothetical protein